MITASLVLSALLQINPAAAQQANCNNPTSQLEMNICAGRELDAADADLNDAWKITNRAMKKRDADLPDYLRGAAKALLEGQRGWIKYRDGQCGVERSEFAGGSMAPMVGAMCLTRMTRARTKELLKIANPEY